jgi:nitroreductase/NAD-dependent dihydropyrimidine dehydrogenase PreA subunit
MESILQFGAQPRDQGATGIGKLNFERFRDSGLRPKRKAMFEKVTTTIDENLCTGCGLCVQICPSKTLSMLDGKAAVTGQASLNCGHCMAICPVGAINVGAIDGSMSQFECFETDLKWLPYGEFDTSQLARLMASRRSCRNFLDKPVAKAVLNDLVKIGCTAPSATNCQLWTFTLLPTREAVLVLGKAVRDFYVALNSMAEKSWLRTFMKLTGKPELNRYYQEYYEFVKEGLVEFDLLGIDRLFHGASSAIVVGCKPGASLPKEDAMLASQNILLGAHSLGLGSCLIGMAVEAMKNDKKIQGVIRIPDDETVYAVIALGYPNEHYKLLAGRKRAVARVFEQ